MLRSVPRRLILIAALVVCAGVLAVRAAESPDLGFPHHPPELRARLAAALTERAGTYDPRTEHLLPDGRPRFTNRLLLEDSPYLRQHAHNPVDWYPWGPEALTVAAREEKPILLSIGYSTCHWCHVMERESFDDIGIAGLLGESFVAIKVDREQRPDVDDVYMTAVHLSGRQGGWPLTAFLTPDGKPFFGASYLPPDRFSDALRAVARVWKEDRANVEVTAASLADAVSEVVSARAEAVEIGADAAERARADLLARADAEHGGFGGAPKFPHEPELLFLLDEASRGESGALAVVERTLDAMARGGIFDQVGGGFHRYATDERWRVPHFEKMLYNQALLTRAYVRGARLTGRPSLAAPPAETLLYVLREMTSAEGGFYSATDADSEGAEGRFFVWTLAELERALGGEDAAWAARVFGVTAEGNFEEGRTVLHLPAPLDELAREAGMSLGLTMRRLLDVKVRLREARERREKPLRDEKVLTGWNGMMITALAEAHAVLGGDTATAARAGPDRAAPEIARPTASPRTARTLDERAPERSAHRASGATNDGRSDGPSTITLPAGPSPWLPAAERAAELLWTRARRGPGRLWRVLLDGEPSVPALLEDYAALAEAMLTLYDVTGDRRWLACGTELLDGAIEDLWDAAAGGFFVGPADPAERLIARPKSPHDGATPSGNSIALRALAMAYHRTGETAYRDRADALLRAFSARIRQSPSSFPYLLLGRRELEHGDTGMRRYAARGRVALDASVQVARGSAAEDTAAGSSTPSVRLPDGATRDAAATPAFVLDLALDIAPGWHVNSVAPLEEALVATTVELEEGARVAGWKLGGLSYPEPRQVRLGFQNSPLSVYTGVAVVSGRLEPPAAAAGPAVPITVRLQACDDTLCLRPETVTLRVPVAHLLRPESAPF